MNQWAVLLRNITHVYFHLDTDRKSVYTSSTVVLQLGRSHRCRVHLERDLCVTRETRVPGKGFQQRCDG